MSFFDWISPLGAEVAKKKGHVEFFIDADDIPVLAGVRGLHWEQQIGSTYVATCNKKTWKKVKRILGEAGVGYSVSR